MTSPKRKTNLLTLPTVQLLAHVHIRDLRAMARQPLLNSLVVREGHAYAHQFPTHPLPQLTNIKPRSTQACGRIVQYSLSWQESALMKKQEQLMQQCQH